MEMVNFLFRCPLKNRGTDEKRQWVTRMLGADACVNYNEADSLKRLADLCPSGVDLYWDNVGGSILDAALTVLSPGSRAILCGAINGYDKQTEDPCYNLHLIIFKRIILHGFIVRNYESEYKNAVTALMGWAKQGKLVSKETVLQGLEQVPDGPHRRQQRQNARASVCRPLPVA